MICWVRCGSRTTCLKLWRNRQLRRKKTLHTSELIGTFFEVGTEKCKGDSGRWVTAEGFLLHIALTYPIDSRPDCKSFTKHGRPLQHWKKRTTQPNPESVKSGSLVCTLQFKTLIYFFYLPLGLANSLFTFADWSIVFTSHFIHS